MDNSVNNRGPILTDGITLTELQQAGADTLADIPLNELLEFVRNQCLSVAKDMNEHGELDDSEVFTSVANCTQEAIDHLMRFIKPHD